MSNVDSNTKQQGYQFGQNHVIESLWLTFGKLDEGSWVLKPQEAILLHEKIKEFNPKQILELGTGIGCSTAIMAFSCPQARIYTVEQNQKCIDLAKKLIPTTLQERIYFRLSEPKVTRPINQINPFMMWSIYGDYDWIDYDFIFVDGPGPFTVNVQGNQVLAEQPNGDILFLLHKMKPGTIIYVDKRKHATILYDRHLCSTYNGEELIQKGYLEKLETSPKHTVYQRTDLPLREDFSDFVNMDHSLYELKKGGYFT